MPYAKSQSRQLNKVTLIGLVACLPRPVGGDGEVGFLLLTQRDLSGQRVDRHRVILPARHGERQRVSVVAHRAWSAVNSRSERHRLRIDRSESRGPVGAEIEEWTSSFAR
jgi:hypothetical protein